jgi:hypothetical protein
MTKMISDCYLKTIFFSSAAGSSTSPKSGSPLKLPAMARVNSPDFPSCLTQVREQSHCEVKKKPKAAAQQPWAPVSRTSGLYYYLGWSTRRMLRLYSLISILNIMLDELSSTCVCLAKLSPAADKMTSRVAPSYRQNLLLGVEGAPAKHALTT